jgi:galactokinase
MTTDDRLQKAVRLFRQHFDKPPEAGAFAPGRVEILGNHTDYNEGFVLSCSIDMGVWLLCSRNGTGECSVVAADLDEHASFSATAPSPVNDRTWPNFASGVYAGIMEKTGGADLGGFDALLTSNIPSGAGLSSSAALEIATGLGLQSLFGIELDRMELARIAQQAENSFVGARCGLLDQISSLFGKADHFIFTDFRSLHVEPVPLHNTETCIIVFDTKKQHSLVDSEYNERRDNCEQAARFLARKLGPPFRSLRDAGRKDWEMFSPGMDETVARRALHIIEENERVIRGKEILEGNGSMEAFGQLMFESHESSRRNFNNSCSELDHIVSAASGIDGALGARLSGGGFGGAAIVLAYRQRAEDIRRSIEKSYADEFGVHCEASIITPAEGANLLNLSDRE